MFGVIRRFYVLVYVFDKFFCIFVEFQILLINYGYYENYCVFLFNNDFFENYKLGVVRKFYIILFFESDGK